MSDDYIGAANKLGNVAGLPFSSFNEGSGVLDLAFSADDIRRMNSMFWADGIRPDSGNWDNGDGAVIWAGGFSVTVRPFRAHVNGTVVYSGQISLTLDNEPLSTRVDSIVIRRDYQARTVNVMVLKGVSGGSATPPALTYNDGGVAEFELARVTITGAMQTLSQADIQDMRVPLAVDLGLDLSAANKGAVLYVGDRRIEHGGLLPRLATQGEVNDGVISVAQPDWTQAFVGPIELAGLRATLPEALTGESNRFVPADVLKNYIKVGTGYLQIGMTLVCFGRSGASYAAFAKAFAAPPQVMMVVRLGVAKRVVTGPDPTTYTYGYSGSVLYSMGPVFSNVNVREVPSVRSVASSTSVAGITVPLPSVPNVSAGTLSEVIYYDYIVIGTALEA